MIPLRIGIDKCILVLVGAELIFYNLSVSDSYHKRFSKITVIAAETLKISAKRLILESYHSIVFQKLKSSQHIFKISAKNGPQLIILKISGRKNKHPCFPITFPKWLKIRKKASELPGGEGEDVTKRGFDSLGLLEKFKW